MTSSSRAAGWTAVPAAASGAGASMRKIRRREEKKERREAREKFVNLVRILGFGCLKATFGLDIVWVSSAIFPLFFCPFVSSERLKSRNIPIKN